MPMKPFGLSGGGGLGCAQKQVQVGSAFSKYSYWLDLASIINPIVSHAVVMSVWMPFAKLVVASRHVIIISNLSKEVRP